MPFKIIRNDITRMHTQAIVNTANEHVAVGTGCDSAIYKAAGYEKLLAYRAEHIGSVPEGEVFLTPGFDLGAQYIIHAVSPRYKGGGQGEEEKLRSCYRKSLALAREKSIISIAFPLIATGGFGYPREEVVRIAVDEIMAFLQDNNMWIYLVVFDDRSTQIGRRIYPGLEAYIDQRYAGEKKKEEYSKALKRQPVFPQGNTVSLGSTCASTKSGLVHSQALTEEMLLEFTPKHEERLEERMKHISDTFSEYLMYLIQRKQMENADVWKRAIVDKKVFSKIKNHPDYHPKKITALCLCVGARLNLDETKDLLARAGYALSPCDKTDIIFAYFIENEIYDMIELDIQLEEHGLACVIT